MQVFRGQSVPHQPADPKSFVGQASVKRLAQAKDGTPVVVYHVEFEAGARTNWHVHTGAQWLLVVNGRIRLQQWGGSLQELSEGDAAVIAPGEKHWHGAASGARGAHLAINVNATTEWLEPVKDE